MSEFLKGIKNYSLRRQGFAKDSTLLKVSGATYSVHDLRNLRLFGDNHLKYIEKLLPNMDTCTDLLPYQSLTVKNLSLLNELGN